MKPIKEKRQNQPEAQARDSQKPSVALRAGREEDQAFRQQLQRTGLPSVAATHVPPGLPPGVTPLYLPLVPPTATIAPPDAPPPPKRSLLYQARLLGFAEVDFIDKKRGLEYHRTYRLIADEPSGETANWSSAVKVPGDLAEGPSPNAQWTDVPDGMNTVKKLKTLQKTLADFLYISARLSLLESHAKLGLRSEPGEDVQTFLAKCREAILKPPQLQLQQAPTDNSANRP